MSTAQELQAQIDKMSVELDNLRKQVIQQGTKNFANRVSNAEEQFIANRAKASGIDMSEPLPNEDTYEEALRKRTAAINDKIDRAHYMHFSRELKKDLDSKKKKGGKSKRNSHKHKSRKHKSRKDKQSKRSKH